MTFFVDIGKLGQTIIGIVGAYGGLGVMVGMFLESSFVPIPSEVVLIAAGMTGIGLLEVTLFGALGSTLGSIVGWAIGNYGGRPAVNRWGRYVLVSDKKVEEAEKWFKRWGGWTVFLCRLIPVVPFKVFSITAGILRYDLKLFLVFTFIGSIPRAFILASVGAIIAAVEYELLALLLASALIILLLGRRIRRKDAHDK